MGRRFWCEVLYVCNVLRAVCAGAEENSNIGDQVMPEVKEPKKIAEIGVLNAERIAAAGVASARMIVPIESFNARGLAPLLASPPALVNHGGPVLGAVQVVPIFWGAAWGTAANATLATQLEGFFSFIVTSSYMDLLAEYSTGATHIGHGTRLPSVHIPGNEPGTIVGGVRTVTDAQIQVALQGWIAAHTAPATTPNTLYFVYLPPNVVSVLGGGGSCTNYCGYHNHNAGVFYAVIPYVTCAGCVFPGAFLDTLTEVSSHEFAEAVTDPALNAWFDAAGDEIGDICNRQTVRMGGFLVQTEWSNSQNACVIAPATVHINNTLSFIKTANTPSHHVEVHLASGTSGYQTRILEVATTFVNETDGVWQLQPNQDLVFIKTSNTPNGHVEVHIASKASNYQTRILETATTFVNESDGVWQLLANQDLVFIKTSNTPNGHVEVHIASRASNYHTRILETATTFVNESDGVWQLMPNLDLAFIKTSNTPNGHVEVHIGSRASNYHTRILETATTFANETDGTWLLLPNLDLTFIKTNNTPNGHVEVHIASRASNYQSRIVETATTFANETDGVWGITVP